MNPLQQSGGPSGAYNVPVNTGQPMAAASSQPQHPHPTQLDPASLSPSAHRLLDHTETQGSDLHQLMALLVRNSVIDGTLTLQSRQDAHAHFAREVNIPGEINKAVLTVRVRLSEASQYDIAGIDLCSPLWSRKESFEAPAAQPLEQAAWSTPARRPPSAFSHEGSAGESAPQPRPARTRLKPTRSASYAEASQSSGSRPTIAPVGRCNHKPAPGVISTETFVGCDITDNELEAGNKQANQRIRSRKSLYKKMQASDSKSLTEIRKEESDKRAREKGFPDRKKADLARRDDLAAKRHYKDRYEADQARKDNLAQRNGFDDRKDALRAKRAADKAATQPDNV